VGDELVGVMTLIARNENLFDYTCEFQGIPNSSLTIQNVPELTWANETLEAYGVN
jgi:hypothetical protein